jgi:DNA polymerase-3 subunit chi
MTEVLFYHLQNAPLEQVLPQLLERSLARDWRAVVKVGNAERMEALVNTLWTYREDSFLPHGTRDDGPAEQHPVFLTVADENPNAAQVVFLVDGAEPGDIAGYERCVLMFDGRDEEALTQARAHWKALKGAGHDATYWQQSDEGRWEKKA